MISFIHTLFSGQTELVETVLLSHIFSDLHTLNHAVPLIYNVHSYVSFPRGKFCPSGASSNATFLD